MEGVLKNQILLSDWLKKSLVHGFMLEGQHVCVCFREPCKSFKLKTFKSTIEYSVLQLKKDNK